MPLVPFSLVTASLIGPARGSHARSFCNKAMLRQHRALLATCALAACALAHPAPAVAGCNSGNVPSTALLSSANCQASASGSDSVAVGGSAEAAAGGTAVGISADATGAWSTALGSYSDAKGQFSTVIGSFAGRPGAAINGMTAVGFGSGFEGAGMFSTAIGAGNTSSAAPHASGGYGVAIGGSDDPALPGARASGYRSIAIGQASVSADFGTAVGFNSNTAFASTAIGTDALASADSSTAVGRFSKASGISSSAFGADSRAEGDRSIALGHQSRGIGTNAVALGWGARATASNAVAIGRGSLANAGNTVSVGSTSLKRRIINVAPGVSANDAVNLAQLQSATAAVLASVSPAPAGAADAAMKHIEDMRRELASLRALVTQQQQRIAQLESRNVAAAPTSGAPDRH